MSVFAPFVLRRRPARLIGLSAVVIFVIIANAFVTGVFSNVEDRYQSRVIWLLPLLAILFALEPGAARQLGHVRKHLWSAQVSRRRR
jgi:hypothetical protein